MAKSKTTKPAGDPEEITVGSPDSCVAVDDAPAGDRDEFAHLRLSLTLEDLLPDAWYHPQEVQSLIGIPQERIVEALRKNEFSRVAGSGANATIGNGSLIAWIERHKIPWEPTALACHCWRLKHPPASKPEPSKRPDVIGQAARLVTEEKSRDAAGEEAWRRQYVTSYLSLLSKPAPDDRDVSKLAEAMDALGIDESQAREDKQLVAAVRDQELLYSERESANAAIRGRREPLKAIQKRYEEEMLKARRQISAAENHAAQCNRAADEIRRLSRKRPELFDVTSDPPKLRVASG